MGERFMPRTSNKAELILDFVNQFVQENGYAPSVREIGAAVGLRSTASVSSISIRASRSPAIRAFRRNSAERFAVLPIRTTKSAL